jgi:hypothetical protein
VFQNRGLRRIFGPKREEVAGGWRRLHNEERHNLYTSPDIIRVIKSRRMSWMGHVACMGEMRNTYIILIGRTAGKRPKRPFGRSSLRCEDNIRTNLGKIGWKIVN